MTERALRAVRFDVPKAEGDRYAAAARAAGYHPSEFYRKLVRVGWEEVSRRGTRREDGLHFLHATEPVTAPGGAGKGEKAQRAAG